ESDPERGMFLVRECQRVIREANPKWWAIENPATGTLRNYLGKPDYTYQPWWYGSPWTKSTGLWGRFNIPPRRYHDWADVPKLDLWTRPGRIKPSIVYLHKSAFDLIPEFRVSGMPARPTDAERRYLCSHGIAAGFKDAKPSAAKKSTNVVIKATPCPSCSGTELVWRLHKQCCNNCET